MSDHVPLAKWPIRLVDSSQLGAGFRLHLAYDPMPARFASACLTSSADGDKLDRLLIEPGEILIVDRGFPKPEGLRDTLKAGADVVVRVTWNSPACATRRAPRRSTGSPCSSHQARRRRRHGGRGHEVQAHKVQGQRSRSGFEPIAMRLIPKPPEAVARASAVARETNRKKGRASIDPRTLAGVEHMVLLSSLSADIMPVARLAELYRTRWQIELAFKRLKSILKWNRRPAEDARLARAWLRAHFLFALLIDTCQDDLPDDAADGALRS